MAEDERPEPEAPEPGEPSAQEPEAPEAEVAEHEESPPQEPEEPAGPQEVTVEELQAAMREIKIGAFLLQTTSTLASLAYGKLELAELDEARAAIDAIGAILPVLEGRVDEPVRKDFERALANLRLAYASAAAKSEPPGEPPGPAA